MGDSSYVQGNIHARDAAIKGKIKGDIHVKEALHLMDTAVIEGNITAKTMVVDEGARYNGACRIGEGATAKG
jgi:cytoskeletal protein CcmA (bactofilin family)